MDGVLAKINLSLAKNFMEILQLL